MTANSVAAGAFFARKHRDGFFFMKRTIFPRIRGEKTGNSPLYKVGYATHSPAPMTFAAINWLNISINLLLVIFVIVCLLMTLLILMQRPKQEGLGAAFGGGVTDQVFGARTTNVLQRGTIYLGSMFFILSLVLAILIGHQNKQKKLLPAATPAAKVEATKPEAPKIPALPKSLSDELPAEIPATPDSPATVPADAPAPTPAPEATMPAAPTETAPVAPAEAAPPAAPAETAPPAAPAENEAPKDK